jgi:predicted AAA+ superfamily ATPase
MKISPATADKPPIILVYGAEGRGKTTLACKFPKPLALLLERGLPRGVTVDAVEDVNSYDEIIATLRKLIEDARGYETLVIDTLDALEPLLIEAVCLKHSWKNIESPSYGKGWLIADDEWRRLIRGLTALRDRQNMTVVLVAHSTIERFDDPRAPTFTTYLPKLHKRARHLILDASDVVGFLAEDLRTVTDEGGFRERVRATNSNARFLFVEGCPAFTAKNRFAMPPKVAIPADFNVGELTQHWSNHDRGK